MASAWRGAPDLWRAARRAHERQAGGHDGHVQVAAQLGVLCEGWISRASELPFGLSSLAFTLAKPEEGRHTYSAESANRLTSLVIDLAGVRVPEGDSDTGISALYLSQENNEMFISLIKQLRENAEIKVFTDLL